ncbi:MAG: phage tail protein [Planctomycetes bacterium]|nr:phage tail protein [Planctomycetota bacterium]
MRVLLKELLRGDRFDLELEGVSAAGFVSCSGLQSRREVLEYREGGSNRVELFEDGPGTGRLVFERGLTFDAELWSWYESAQPRGGAVVLLDEDGNESMRWNFSGALAVGWEGPPLDARNPEIALEKLEIAYEGLECKRT